MADFIGTSGGDIYNSGVDGDYIDGAGGKDSLNGNGGNDSIQGGAGADTLIGGAGNDFLASFEPDEFLDDYPWSSSVSQDVYAERDSLIGGDGDDYFAVGYGDAVDGGEGRNWLYINFMGATSGVHADFQDLYADGSMTIGGGVIRNITEVTNIQGSDFDDYLRATSDGYSFSTVNGHGGDDTLIASYYTTYLSGDAGNDTIDAGGSQYLHEARGGDGDDTLDTLGANGVAYGDAGDDIITANYLVYGGSGDDNITSHFSYYNNDAYGEDGNDTISESSEYDDGPNNRFFGGQGADRLNGRGGDDQLFSDGVDPDNLLDHALKHDRLDGGLGDDILSIGHGDDADGGEGVDVLTMVWSRAANGVQLDTADILSGDYNFSGGVVENIELIDSLYMTDHNDRVKVAGQDGVVTVYGEAGSDRLAGSGTAVHLFGGDGGDTLTSGAGGDILDGGAGNDVYVVGGSGVEVVEAADDGRDRVQSAISFALGEHLEDLTLTGLNIKGFGNDLGNVVKGSGGSNSLFGMDGDDFLQGLAGADKLEGGVGDDKLWGGDDADVLKGGGSSDLLAGDAGADTLTGGGGRDSFVFKSLADIGGLTAGVTDRITDFRHGELDRIDLSGVDAISGDGDEAFTFVGTAAFSGQAGELRYEVVGKDTLVTGDLDGDGAADFMIVLSRALTLVAGDFVL